MPEKWSRRAATGMTKALIFAGTTEGRRLAEFCAEKGIPADVSSATAYGAALLPAGVGSLSGRLDAAGIRALLAADRYGIVIDATHPYAADITQTLRTVCGACGIPYARLIRAPEPVFGEAFSTLDEMISVLNENKDAVLSTLGSKSAPLLTAVSHYAERIRLRILPSQEAAHSLLQLGFRQIIQAKGPFSVEDNIRHIRESGAKLLLTKESGRIGGYPEKAEAARRTGIRMLTLRRPQETGLSFAEITAVLLSFQENQT